MTEHLELRSRHATEKSEGAFTEFNLRNVDPGYSAALCPHSGTMASAHDRTGQVVAQVARQGRRLAGPAALVSWLYTTARLMALRTIEPNDLARCTTSRPTP